MVLGGKLRIFLNEVCEKIPFVGTFLLFITPGYWTLTLQIENHILTEKANHFNNIVKGSKSKIK